MGKPPNEMGNCPFAPTPLDTPLRTNFCGQSRSFYTWVVRFALKRTTFRLLKIVVYLCVIVFIKTEDITYTLISTSLRSKKNTRTKICLLNCTTKIEIGIRLTWNFSWRNSRIDSFELPYTNQNISQQLLHPILLMIIESINLILKSMLILIKLIFNHLLM